MRLRLAIRIVAWVITIPVIYYGIVLIGTTIVVSLIGGPMEPPTGMSGEAFQKWRESGKWFWEDVIMGVACVVISLFVAIAATIATRNRKLNIEPRGGG